MYNNSSILNYGKLLIYFLQPTFFSNLIFMLSVMLIYLQQIKALPYILTLNLFILIVGSIISVFYARNVVNIALDYLDITKYTVPRYSNIHILLIIIGILIHVFMTIFLLWYTRKSYTIDDIKYAKKVINKNRLTISSICIIITLLYFATGLYNIYGIDTTGIIVLFIIGPFIMYSCTYLVDYIL